MGVSLERVQNKFACIIGELCSEPVVLSQFAIWLDLRLAEYKLKGAISLECSGDNPDPIWLKGHKSSTPRIVQRETNPTNSALAALRDSQSTRNISSVTDELSHDVVVVKEELPGSADNVRVFPVSLICRDDMGSNRTSMRKRTATNSIPSEHDSSQSESDFLHRLSPSIVTSSPAKVRRVASPGESEASALTLEPVSESLISIISRDLQEESSQTLDVSDCEDDYDQDDRMGDNSNRTFPSEPEYSIPGGSTRQLSDTAELSNNAAFSREVKEQSNTRESLHVEQSTAESLTDEQSPVDLSEVEKQNLGESVTVEQISRETEGNSAKDKLRPDEEPSPEPRPSISSAQSHQPRTTRRRNPQRSLSCDLCKFTTRWQFSLIRHMDTHNEPDSYPCSICGKSYKGKTARDSHHKICTSGLVCQYCGKIYTSRQGLHSHRRLVHLTTSLICPICDKKFATKNHYDGHMNRHANRKCTCETCGAGFVYPADLKAHSKRGCTPKPAEEDKKFVCHTCGKHFKTAKTGKEHVCSMHLGLKRPKCTKCLKTFKWRSSLSYHMKKCQM